MRLLHAVCDSTAISRMAEAPKPGMDPITSSFDPRLPHPNPAMTRGQRVWKLASLALCTGMGAWIIFRGDFGEGEHVFSPVCCSHLSVFFAFMFNLRIATVAKMGKAESERNLSGGTCCSNQVIVVAVSLLSRCYLLIRWNKYNQN